MLRVTTSLQPLTLAAANTVKHVMKISAEVQNSIVTIQSLNCYTYKNLSLNHKDGAKYNSKGPIISEIHLLLSPKSNVI